jgi:3-oxoacyl-[acyl-carrier-protein] synthase III
MTVNSSMAMDRERRAVILGSGSYVPEKILSNDEIEAGGSAKAEWISRKLGIHERRIVAEGELTSDMAGEAALKALAASKIDPLELDLIILATATPDRLAPSTACIVQERIGAFNAAAFDMNAVCSGYLFGLATAASFISGMGLRKVLVIGADCFSRFTDWSSRDAGFFGDGAGAVVLGGEVGDTGFQSFRLGSDGRGKFDFTIARGGAEVGPELLAQRPDLRWFQMNAKEVYNTATRVLPEAIDYVLKENSLTISDIDHLLPHQASRTVLGKVAEIIGMPIEKVRTNMDRYANTSSATIPILLDETIRAGRISKNEKALFAAVGSGWTWGAALYNF